MAAPTAALQIIIAQQWQACRCWPSCSCRPVAAPAGLSLLACRCWPVAASLSLLALLIDHKSSQVKALLTDHMAHLRTGRRASSGALRLTRAVGVLSGGLC